MAKPQAPASTQPQNKLAFNSPITDYKSGHGADSLNDQDDRNDGLSVHVTKWHPTPVRRK
jgi:hypothetical protein